MNDVDLAESQLRSLMRDPDMTRRGFAVASLATGFAMAVRPVSAQTITTDATGLVAGEVKVPVADGTIPAYRSHPATGSNWPTILVVQEIFGVHEHIKDLTRRLAKAGYYAIAPELYARQGDASKYTDIPTLYQEVVSKVPDGQVVSDLDRAVAFAKSEKADTAKLGITGFCWGGRQVWLYTAHNPAVKAGAAWYGQLAPSGDRPPPAGIVNPVDVADKIKGRVIGFYGAADQGIPQSSVEAMREALKKAGDTKTKIEVYPDTPHGFNADYRPSYRPEQAKDAWAKMLAWFKQNGV
ncbi:MAG: clcD [Rhodospirillales bacterium]|jgi:carboxymethylenebutenolidase|nr:clcD [Rhodospirillales bacterium]